MTLSFPYGKTKMTCDFEKLAGVLTSAIEEYEPPYGETELVEQALAGCRFTLGDMQKALRDASEDSEVVNDLCVLLSKQQL